MRRREPERIRQPLERRGTLKQIALENFLLFYPQLGHNTLSGVGFHRKSAVMEVHLAHLAAKEQWRTL
jgi:hypothetical protein